MIKIALAQLRCDLLNKEINLKRSIEAIVEAHKKGADYILFPELFLTGYVINTSLVEMGESIEGPSIRALCSYAKKYSIGIIYGFPEKDGDSLYNSAVFIDKNGSIRNVYRKAHLYGEEQKYFTPGEDFSVVEVPEGKFGLMITYDMEFPEMARVLSIKGAEILLILAANMVPYQTYQDTYLHSRALENHVFTLAANNVGLHLDNIFFGESQVVAPNGKALYKADNNEVLQLVDINLEEVEHSKGPLNYLNNRKAEFYRRGGL